MDLCELLTAVSYALTPLDTGEREKGTELETVWLIGLLTDLLPQEHDQHQDSGVLRRPILCKLSLEMSQNQDSNLKNSKPEETVQVQVTSQLFQSIKSVIKFHKIP